MKNKDVFFIFCLTFFFILSSANESYAATVGIGLKWFTESEYVKEGTIKCIDYGLYNPFDQDVRGYLVATKDLESLYDAEKPKLIPANTSSKNAILTKICFKIPKKVYQENCILGMMCKKKCENIEEKSYKGEVIAQYDISRPNQGVGSVVGSSFAAPLELKVKCEKKERNWLPLILVVIIVAAIIVWQLIKRKHKNRF